jgi:trehalose/maltose hydrolase-like predicted phosphorylase
MGQRANFEESYSGDFQGSYIAGIYYPIKLKWDGGKMAPEYFAKVLNAPTGLESILK